VNHRWMRQLLWCLVALVALASFVNRGGLAGGELVGRRVKPPRFRLVSLGGRNRVAGAGVRSPAGRRRSGSCPAPLGSASQYKGQDRGAHHQQHEEGRADPDAGGCAGAEALVASASAASARSFGWWRGTRTLGA